VLGSGAVAVLVLLQGIFQLEITTDPVQLWASPTSRSRLEKDFFDSRFRPFYRTEQIFFKAVDMENVEILYYFDQNPKLNINFLARLFTKLLMERSHLVQFSTKLSWKRFSKCKRKFSL
jgi:hypothetical protein